jgi:ABC-type glycerol-3-phosphate transport system permease component
MRRDDRRKWAETAKHAFIVGMLMLTFYPVFLMLAVSFKDNAQYAANPWFFDAPQHWNWGNWGYAWSRVRIYVANSVIVAAGGTLLAMVMTVLASYVLARYRFPGRQIFYYAVMGLMFLPGSAASLVTLYDLLQRLGLMNSLWGLLLVGAASGQVLGIYVIKQFVEALPLAWFEAARMEGAGHWKQISEIVLPTSRPILTTVAIMQFMNLWNDVVLPLTLLRDDHRLTITVGLMRMEGEYVKHWGELMAGYTLASLPLVVLFLFLNRMFLKGVVTGRPPGH